MSDSIEIELQEKFINAQYDYINYLRKKQLSKFLEEVRDYVWDDNHWAYKIWHPSDSIITINADLDGQDGQDIKQLYYKLTKITHPDKCDELWSAYMFIIINEAYNKNNYKKLKEISNYWDEHNTFEFYINNTPKKDIIHLWINEAWYDWFNNPDSLLREVLISPQEYEKRCEKLREENRRLKKMHDDLNQLVSKN